MEVLNQGESRMDRREFSKIMGAVVAGMAASKAFAGDEKKAAGGEKHSCKGKNECKGKGGCKTGDNGCASKNSCKGKGGCASAAAKHDCKGKNDCKGLGGCKTLTRCAGTNACKARCSVPPKPVSSRPEPQVRPWPLRSNADRRHCRVGVGPEKVSS
jgi:hypothetical protein